MKTRSIRIQKIILQSLYGVGVLSIALLAPNVFSAFGKIRKGKFRNENYRFKRSIRRLMEEGLIVLQKTPKGEFARLTPEGEKRAMMIHAGEVKIKKPVSWDGKWRVVVYDFSEEKKALRDRLRATLVGFGFVRLQKSIWVYPYECEDLIDLIKADFKIGRDILYMVAERVENDRWLRGIFKI